LRATVAGGIEAEAEVAADRAALLFEQADELVGGIIAAGGGDGGARAGLQAGGGDLGRAVVVPSAGGGGQGGEAVGLQAVEAVVAVAVGARLGAVERALQQLGRVAGVGDAVGKVRV